MHKNFVTGLWASRANKFCRWIGLVVMMGVLPGCGEDPQQLFETAQFEEQQHNQAHAKELYERILREDGDSEVAKMAEVRLKELQKEQP